MVHNFYAGMGGFIMELDSVPEDQGMTFIPGDEYLSLSARGIAFLAQCGHLPNLTEKDITDKSKADGLAKSLVCLQAAYMVILVIRRPVTRPPITLLKVKIFGLPQYKEITPNLRAHMCLYAVKSVTRRISRWRLAAEAVRIYPILEARLGHKHETTMQDWFETKHEELMTRGAINWPVKDLLRGTQGLVMGMVLWYASIEYGAIHIAAWNNYFPSTLERWLWRTSAIWIVFLGSLWLLINIAAHEGRALDAHWDRVLTKQAHWSSYDILGPLCMVRNGVYSCKIVFGCGGFLKSKTVANSGLCNDGLDKVSSSSVSERKFGLIFWGGSRVKVWALVEYRILSILHIELRYMAAVLGGLGWIWIGDGHNLMI